MSGIDEEILLAAGYSIFLIITAACLELAARHSHRRSELMRVTGFRYDPRFDLWHCPNNEKLLRAEIDYKQHIVFYRAAAHACNSCPIKDRCTDSDDGRVIERRPESWVESELRRFHRGISIALVVLAAFILTIELVRYSSKEDRILVAGMLLCLAIYGSRLAMNMIKCAPSTEHGNPDTDQGERSY